MRKACNRAAICLSVWSMWGCTGQGAAGEVTTETSALTTYQVGPGTSYASVSQLPALAPGDVVEVRGDATYGPIVLNRAGTADAKITIRGVPVNGKRPVISGGVNSVAFEGSHHLVFEGFEVTGGSSRCVFNHANDVTVRDTVIHDCPAHGVLGADNDSGSFTLDHVEIYRCGAGDSKHQIYIATDELAYPGSVFRMQYCYLHDGNGGHGVKSRAERNEIYYNWIEGSYYHELELIGPDPSGDTPEDQAREDSDVVGNVIRKTGLRPGGHVVRIGGDATGQSKGRYRFVNNTFLLGAGTGSVFRIFDTIDTLEAHNNVFYREGSAAIDLVRTVEAVGTPMVSGSHNWATAGSTIPGGFAGTATGADPGFTALGTMDLRPGAGSPMVDKGQSSPIGVTGRLLPNGLPTPAFEPPVRDAAAAPAPRRAGSDAIDIGAFEAAGTVVVTPPPPVTPPVDPTPPPVTPPMPVCTLAPAADRMAAGGPTDTQARSFVATTEVTPSSEGIDAGIGIGEGAIDLWSDSAMIVLFSETGTIQARNGDRYMADTAVPYRAGATYGLRIEANVWPDHTYSVFVTPPGEAEVPIARNYQFRTVWQQVGSLNFWAAIAERGSLLACNFGVRSL
jgi:hypothetical protein